MLDTLTAHSSVSYADVVHQLKLPRGFVGQMHFSSNQPVAVAARAVVAKHGYSGFEPVRRVSDAASTVYAPYVEDTAAFSTSLLVSNPTLNPADVTVTFVDTEDTTGGTSGSVSGRDVPVAVHADTSLPDVVRWVLRETTTTPSDKHGFIVVTTPQGVTAQAKIVDNVTADPATPGLESAVTSAFSPFLIRVEPFTFQLAAPSSEALSTITLADGAATTTALSRFSVSNPAATTATVELSAINATGGTPTQPFVVTLRPNAQFLTEDLVTAMGCRPSLSDPFPFGPTCPSSSITTAARATPATSFRSTHSERHRSSAPFRAVRLSRPVPWLRRASSIGRRSCRCRAIGRY